VKRIFQPKSTFVCRAKNRQEHCDFDRAGGVKPAVASNGKSKTALEIEQRHCDRACLALARCFFQFFAQT
jgi:hypothetical protein